MLTPYDWQEGIGNRAQYIEAKLQQGAPVLAVSLEEGILVFTYRRQGRKIFEIYDRLLMAGIGQQSDVEALRVAALEFASREGYSRSEQDVTIQRVATAMSTPLKRAFSDFSSSPLVARTLFAEVNDSPAEDLYYTLDYDGDYAMSRNAAVIAGNLAQGESGEKRLLEANLKGGSLEERISVLTSLWQEIAASESSDSPAKNLTPECVLLERASARENRFRFLTPEEF